VGIPAGYPGSRHPGGRRPAAPGRTPAARPAGRDATLPRPGTWPEHPSGPLPSTPGAWPARPAGSFQPRQAARPAPARPLRPGRGIARVVLPGLVLSVIGLGALAVIALWWRSTPRPTDTGALLTAAGDVLGLLAGYGFVVLVALMARLPPLEKGIGTDRLARWHSMGGRYVITLVSGHVPLIVWGYAVSAHVKVTSEAAALLTTYPDVLMATVAWFLLLGVAAFSARAARRRIRYETWYYAHLYTYLAIALAFSHQFADGPAFQSDPTAREAWSALYGTVGALIVWYRVVTPLLSAARHRFTVQYVRPEGPGIVSVFITGRNLDRLRAEPGQFFRWRFLTRELWWQSHPYSLSAMPSPGQMRITVKARGDHSGSLANLAPGTRIIAEGPYGAFTPSLTGRRVLFIAGGVGITPIRAMFAALPKRMSGGITLLYRASHPRDVVHPPPGQPGQKSSLLRQQFEPRRKSRSLSRTGPGWLRTAAFTRGPVDDAGPAMPPCWDGR
jgi:predicted ferric reductase